jgi:bla regulator protein BlaR1
MAGFAFLADLFLKSLIVLGVIGALRVILRNRPAALRHYAGTILFLGLLLLPPTAFILPAWRIPDISLPFISSHEWTSTQFPLLSDGLIFASITPGDEEPTRISSAGLWWSCRAWIFVIYLIGVGLILVRWLIGVTKVLLAGRSSHRLTGLMWGDTQKALWRELGGQRKVELRRSPGLQTPVTFGLWSPVVLLPLTCTAWEDGRRRRVLLHEFAHVARMDCGTKMLIQIVCGIFWFNPLVWAIARKLQLDAEYACDSMVLASDTRASDYADDLLYFARLQTVGGYGPALAIALRQTQLTDRLQMILNQQRNHRPMARVSKVCIAAILLAIVVPLSLARFYDSPDAGMSNTAAHDWAGSLDRAELDRGRPEANTTWQYNNMTRPVNPHAMSSPNAATAADRGPGSILHNGQNRSTAPRAQEQLGDRTDPPQRSYNLVKNTQYTYVKSVQHNYVKTTQYNYVKTTQTTVTNNNLKTTPATVTTTMNP